MNAKLKKIVQNTAAAIFLIALVVNIQVTLDDPFQMVSEQALATGVSGSNGSTSGQENDPGGWFWEESDREVTITESSGGGFEIYIVGSGGGMHWDGTTTSYTLVQELCIDGWSMCDLTHWL